VRRPPAPRRQLNPQLLRAVARAPINKGALATAAGFSHYSNFFVTLRAATVPATPLLVGRLKELARLVEFPVDQIFLDEVGR
jgi:hypothetical protein